MADTPTSLKRIMEEREVSLYKLLQRMGHNPYYNHSQWRAKIDGKKPMTIPQLQLILDIVSEESPALPQIQVSDIKFLPERIIVQ